MLPYLHDLGVDWVYLSPILQATDGSDARLRRRGPDARRRVPRRRRRAWPRCRPRPGGSAWACSSTSCPTTWAWLARAEPLVVGPAPPRPLLGVRRRVRRRLGGVRRPGDGPGAGRRRRGAGHRAPQPARRDQHYELVSWRRGDGELNYRRFFTITTLAGVRVEEPWVFAESHREIGRWFAEGLVDGLRVDHPDGLLDPGAYLDDLARLTGGAYVLVEKILEPGERLPTSWATAGTTGYDALGLIDRVLVDPGGQAPLDALEARLRGVPVDWASPHPRHQAGRGRRCAAGRGTADRAGAPPLVEDEERQPATKPPSSRTPSPRSSPASRSTARTSRRAASTSTQALAAAREHRPDLADRLRRARAGARPTRATRRRCGSSRRAAW